MIQKSLKEGYLWSEKLLLIRWLLIWKFNDKKEPFMQRSWTQYVGERSNSSKFMEQGRIWYVQKTKGHFGWSTIEEHVLERSHSGVFPQTS